MNKAQLIAERNKNRNKYRYLGMTYYPGLLANKTIHQNNESLKHEIACYMIDCITLRGGDVSIIFPLIKDFIVEFSKNIKTIFDEWCFRGAERSIISQAVPLGEKRKIDRVCLDSNERIEVETNKKVKKENSTTYYI